MNRVTRGTVVLAAAMVVMSCTGDPTSDLRNGADHLVATPSAIFLTSGESNSVVVEVVDKQGNFLESSFNLTSVDVGLDVAEDPTFLNVYDNKGNLVQPSKLTQMRYLIDATAGAGDLSFEVSAGGKSITIPVRVLPISLPVTFSNATPAPSEEVTVTAAAGYSFAQTAVLTHGDATSTDTAFIVSRAADGSSITFIAYPGGTAGTMYVRGVQLDFLPGSSFDLDTDTPFTPAAPFAGTDAFATAPTVTMPAAGASAVLVDGGTFHASSDCQNVNPGGWNCFIYTFTITAPVTLDFSASWANTNDGTDDGFPDLGLYFDDVGHTDPFTHACDSSGSGTGVGDNFESCSITFAPGTYFMQMTTYAEFYPAPDNLDPAWFRIDVTGS
jgi:hypothetical protein